MPTLATEAHEAHEANKANEANEANEAYNHQLIFSRSFMTYPHLVQESSKH